MPATNIDTDQIIPARFLTTTTRSGLGAALFADLRYDQSGQPRPEFVLNQPAARGCEILVAGRNIGCGSSREHAPWALLDFGIKAVVSTDAPPFLIAHGQLDALVPHGQSEQLFGALAAVGAEATFFSVPGVGHDKGIVSPGVPEAVVRSTSSRGTERETRPTLEAIERFLRSALA